MSRKILIDIELLEDFSALTDILYNIAITKNLSEDEYSRLKYVNKLLSTCTELLNKAIEE